MCVCVELNIFDHICTILYITLSLSLYLYIYMYVQPAKTPSTLAVQTTIPT